MNNQSPIMPLADIARPGVSYRRPSMHLTAVAIVAFVLGLILLSQNSATSRDATLLGGLMALTFLVELLVSRNGISFPAPMVCFLAFLCYSAFQMTWAPGSISRLLSLFGIHLRPSYGELCGGS